MSKHKFYGWVPDVPDQRDYLYQAIKPVIRVPKEADLRQYCSIVEDQGNLGSCHDEETEVLSEKGWKFFTELSGKEKLATVNSESMELFYEKPSRLIRFQYIGKMYSATKPSLNFCVTPDHKMLVRPWNEKTKTLATEYKLIPIKDIGWYCGLMNRIVWNGYYPNNIYILKGVQHKHKEQRNDKAISMAVWLRFLGIYLAEGTMIRSNRGKHYKIQIAASKEREKKFFREILAALGVHALELKDRFTFDNRRIYESLSRLGLEGVKAGQKFVPDFVFNQNASMIREFLKGHYYGDGCEQWGHRSHYTGSKHLADDLQRLIFLSGDESRIFIRSPRITIMKDGRKIIGKLNEYRISVCEHKNLSIDRKEDIRREDYSNEVYCAEMPTYHTLVTRRKGCILISGNCTANALAGNLEFLDNKIDSLYSDVSRLFIYYNERALEGSVDYDSGASLRDGIKTLRKTGYCWEVTWPYLIERFAKKPSLKCYVEAKSHCVQSYHRLMGLSDMLTCLAEGYPFVFGFSVYESFESRKVATTGVVTMPKKDERLLGGHAVMAAGFDQKKKRFLVRNSWGPKWGLEGYFTMPYEYLETLAQDFWTIRK
jgi:hypothetical protein